VIAYIDAHRERFGVEPICKILQFAPSTYDAAKRRPPSRLAQRDDALKARIRRVCGENYRVYGADKFWAPNSTGRASGCPLHRGAAHVRPGHLGRGAGQGSGAPPSPASRPSGRRIGVLRVHARAA
jgi:putative transposase